MELFTVDQGRVHHVPEPIGSCCQSLRSCRVTVEPSKLKGDKFVGLGGIAFPKDVIGEGMPIPHTLPAERSHSSESDKHAAILDVTEETILFNRGEQVLRDAKGLGQAARRGKERIIVRGISELDSGAYRPDDTVTTLYSSANGNLLTGTPFGAAGISSADNNLRSQTDENGDPLLEYGPMILVPGELHRLAQETMRTAGGDKVAEVYTSPFLTSSTDWWMGDFPQQFVWAEVQPLTVIVGGPIFDRDILGGTKISFIGDIVSTDYRLVVKCEAA